MKKMKKIIIFLTFGIFLLFPFIVNATLLGNGQLNVLWSYPHSGGSPNYYTDYDGSVVSSNFGYTTDFEEIFCVSIDPANSKENVYFYTISADLNNVFGAGFYEKLAQAAWIADNWETFGTSDEIKGEAQKAIWKILGVMDIIENNGLDLDIYNASFGYDDYITDNWYYAWCPGTNLNNNYQDYLVPTAPVPEPATILLFSIGMMSMYIIRKKKICKNK